MKKSDIINEIKKHPNFYAQPWDDSFEFKDDGVIYLIMFNSARKSSEFPISWDTENQQLELYDAPNWFQELFIWVYEAYYEEKEIKLRQMMNPQYRRHFENILFITAVKENLDMRICDYIGSSQDLVLEKTYVGFMEKAKEELKKYGYEATMVQEGESIRMLID